MISLRPVTLVSGLLALMSTTLAACGGKDGEVRYYTQALVDLTSPYAGTTGNSGSPLTVEGGAMPWDVARYFRVVQNPNDITQGTVSQWAENPAACQGRDIAPIDGTIYGYSCSLDNQIVRATEAPGACASSAGVTVNPTVILPFLSNWSVYPASATVKVINHGNGYTAANADAAESTNLALYQGPDGDFTQISLGYRDTASGDFSLVYFRTADSGSQNLNTNVILGNTGTNEFEAYAVNEDGGGGNTIRVLSRGGFAFVQRWNGNSPAGDPDGTLTGTSEAGARCYSTATLLEVDMSECESAMGGTAMGSGTQDALFRLTLIDWGATTALTADYFRPENHNPFDGNTIPSADGCL